MISLCRKDVLRNHYFIPVLCVVNMMYIVIHFLPEDIFYTMHTGAQAVYVLSIALMLPFLLFMRYGDENISIIENVIRPKLLNIRSYYFYYGFWILLLILGFASASAVAAVFSDNSTLPRSSLFAASILTLCATLMQLCIILFKVINQFIYAFFVYLICLMVLICVNAPDSFLWFVYEPEIEFFVRDHWIGKGILLLVVTGVNGVVSYCKQSKRKGKLK